MLHNIYEFHRSCAPRYKNPVFQDVPGKKTKKKNVSSEYPSIASRKHVSIQNCFGDRLMCVKQVAVSARSNRFFLENNCVNKRYPFSTPPGGWKLFLRKAVVYIIGPLIPRFPAYFRWYNCSVGTGQVKFYPEDSCKDNAHLNHHRQDEIRVEFICGYNTR